MLANRPLSDIAYSCGFADQAHFSRAFKQDYTKASQTAVIPYYRPVQSKESDVLTEIFSG